ncbi:hypothetical protein GCM10012287_56510 [Streptomyces daqingensis]|uniref:SMODS and SLOG-associating 2TM effector domain-containing protein n=1 Tax=Streptomyces daqingensis TaxID=1472640 RepID=A0ABQ2MV85_9ACTN|nr:hypothetical protein [Streptomyces daqingensis]GGO58410.1 hypothetical protein GCM10012287_56510 [Streptomyces daqingensis]
MDTGEQFVTISAVLLGALMTHLTNYMLERSRNRHALLTRWDDKKLDAYEGYVDRVRACIFLAVQLYEHKEDIRESHKPEHEILTEMDAASRLRGRAFERVMLLGDDEVVEAGHRLNAAAIEVDWQANGRRSGTLSEWRAKNRAAFQAINNFHDAAREDLGVKGNVTGESHPERDLLLPPAQRRDEESTPEA